MAFRQFNITFGASAVALSSGISTSGAFAAWNDPPAMQIAIQADKDNSAVVYIGDADVAGEDTSAVVIPIPVSSVPYGPAKIDIPDKAKVRLSEVFVKGTNGEKIRGWVIF